MAADTDTCQSRNASVVSAGYALTKQASDCGRSMQKNMDLLPHATDHPHRFAEIHLRMARRMRQRTKVSRPRAARSERDP